MSGNLTRINNNQISTASAGNAYLGINASTKVQSYTITGGLLANSLTYGSDLTISGNLTVQGTTTAVNTVNTLITDPLIVLADGQTTGTPSVDIGFVGLRGSQNSAVMAWQESNKTFVTALSNTDAGGSSYSNTTININSYADFKANNIVANANLTVLGTTTLTGNVSSLNVTGNVVAGNLATPGTISAAGNITANPSSYFIGNGSQLTGVAASSASFPVSNGTSNINAAVNANVTVGVSGTSNVAVFASTGMYVTGVESVSGNITGGNVLTAGLVSATGAVYGVSFVGNVVATTVSATANVTGGNILTAGLVSSTGTITSAANIIGGNLTTAGQVTATANVTGGNVLTGGLVSSTGTITSAANISGGNITTAGQVTATANITGGNILTGGLISATGNITGGNITIPGSANISTFIGNVFFGSVPAQPTYYNIAPLNINNSLAAATKVQLNLINTGGGAGAGSGIDFYTYQISVAAANAEARIAGIDDGNYSAYLSLQTKTPGSTGTNTLVERVKIDSTGASVVANITGGNILTGGLISSTGNAIHGNLLTSGLISATGNITGGNVLGGANVNATTHTGTTVSVTANITGGNLLTGGLISATGNITGGNLLTGGLVSATSTITSAANITGGNLLTGGLISATSTITSAANITGGNILTNGIISSAGSVFGTVFSGKATTAQYADLAEMYCADANYPPGTVVDFGGTSEITITTVSHSTQVAGIISTNPAYLMNSILDCEVNATEVALVGRVPCFVVGTIRKGDRLVSSNIPGVAQAMNINLYQPGCIVGKALEEYNLAEPGVIEVAVGRI